MVEQAERKDKEDSRAEDRERSSILEHVKTLAAHDARAPLNNETQLLLFLKSWWSRTYNRPLKDPILATYTLEELLYEFYDKVERRKAEEELINLENDKIEEDKEKASLDWAETQERLELEAEAKKTVNASTPSADPTKDPNNIKWMEEQLEKAKTIYGESFGEDIEDDFE